MRNKPVAVVGAGSWGTAFAAMLDAGYTEISTLDLGQGGVTRIYENGTWNVRILAAENEDGTATMQYTITPVSQ